MDIDYPGFGRIVVEGTAYDHDVVLERGRIRPRSKLPSKHLKDTYGHTPLSGAEAIPWSRSRLIVGTGYSGSLPLTPEIRREAVERHVALEAMPTADACALLRTAEASEINAILHVTC